MTQYSDTTDKIIGFIEGIKAKPKKDVKYFFFDEDTKFIVDGKKLKLLPMEITHFLAKDEFYVYVDVKNRSIKYYAFDIEGFHSDAKKNVRFGNIDWSSAVEDSIHNFFVVNIRDLTNDPFPYSSPNKTSTPYASKHSYNCRCATCIPYHHQSNEYDRYKFDNTAYKEREAFCDKIFALQKDGKTSQAIDYIYETITDMTTREKFSLIDDVLRLIAFEKLNIPSMLNLAIATKSIDKLKEKGIFIGKVKDHVKKLKPNRADMVLRHLTTGN